MKRIALSLSFLILFCLSASAQLSADVTAKIDQAAADALQRTGVPSASVAVVKDGKIVYVKAYGDAKLDPRTPADPKMRYSIGSISKQFTAAALLMLQEQGKLSLDDKVGKYIPDLTRERSHSPPVAFAHIGLSGLLAAGLRDAGNAKARDRPTDHGHLGKETARF